MLLTKKTNGRPPDAGILQRIKAELLQLYRYEEDNGHHERRVRIMVDRRGWVEADAFIVVLGIFVVAISIGFAVRERRHGLAALCHGAGGGYAHARGRPGSGA